MSAVKTAVKTGISVANGVDNVVRTVKSTRGQNKGQRAAAIMGAVGSVGLGGKGGKLLSGLAKTGSGIANVVNASKGGDRMEILKAVASAGSDAYGLGKDVRNTYRSRRSRRA